MLDVALPLLACPTCAQAAAAGVDTPAGAPSRTAVPLARDGSALACAAGHRHDVARQGYVNLLSGRGAHGLRPDTAQMVLARERVQSAGTYDAIAGALARTAAQAPPVAGVSGVLDVGGGTGHYAAGVLDARPDLVGVSLDLSRPAAKRAARAHPRLGSVVGDAWAGLPVGDGRLALVTCVFAPRPAEELARALAPGGTLLVVTPRPGHLAALVAAAGMVAVDERKDDRLAQRLAAFEPVGEEVVTDTVEVSPQAAADVVLMGPSAHHVDPDDLAARLAQRPGWPVEIDVRVGAYRRPA